MVAEARAGSQTACLNQLKTSHSTLLFKPCFQSLVLTPPLGATFFVSNVCQNTLWSFLQHLCVHSFLNLETTFLGRVNEREGNIYHLIASHSPWVPHPSPMLGDRQRTVQRCKGDICVAYHIWKVVIYQDHEDCKEKRRKEF